MKTVAAAKFKEQCLSILDHLDAEGIVVTKHGKPVAKVVPMERASADLIGAWRGRIVIEGDIMSTGVKWDACRGAADAAGATRARAPRARDLSRRPLRAAARAASCAT